MQRPRAPSGWVACARANGPRSILSSSVTCSKPYWSCRLIVTVVRKSLRVSFPTWPHQSLYDGCPRFRGRSPPRPLALSPSEADPPLRLSVRHPVLCKQCISKLRFLCGCQIQPKHLVLLPPVDPHSPGLRSRRVHSRTLAGPWRSGYAGDRSMSEKKLSSNPTSWWCGPCGPSLAAFLSALCSTTPSRRVTYPVTFSARASNRLPLEPSCSLPSWLPPHGQCSSGASYINCVSETVLALSRTPPMSGRRHLGHERFARVTFRHTGPTD